MNESVSGIVLRAKDKYVTALFYSEIGLVIKPHQHGGPEHYEMGPVSKGFVVEIYQASDKFSKDALMLEVESLQTSLKIARQFGLYPITTEKQTSDMKFVYIRDPDGRDLMLIEKI